ncbi:MAG: murein biosynthesis integral membrane protein MurJ [Patescibacteria group bacterium]
MFKKFIQKLTTTITGGAILIALFSVVSKILGLLRDRLFASMFGAGEIMDMYYAAFKLPDLVFNTLILGALSAAFIPVFVTTWKRNKAEAWQVANALLTVLSIFVGSVSIVVIICAPRIIPWVVPGFENHMLETTVHLTRIMFISVVFFTISNVLSGMLNSWKQFTAFSLAPVLYNVGIILGILLLYPWWGISGLAWGVVLGSVFHMSVQLYPVVKKGWRFRPAFAWNSLGVKKVILLMIPRTFALAAGQINQLVMVVIASTLAVGSITIFNLASNLQSVNIIGISLAISCFPVFSEHISQKKYNSFKKVFSLNTRRILYVMVPVSAMLFLLRAQVVRLVLGTGEFDWSATIMTATTLGFFAISLFAQSLIPLLTRAFYAYEDTKTPVVISIIGVIINIVGAWYLRTLYGVGGLALAFSIASIVQLILLFIFLRIKISLDLPRIFTSFTKVLVMTLCMSIFVYASLYAVAPLVNMQTFFGVLIQTSVAMIVGGLVYIAMSFAFNMEEIDVLTRQLKKYLKFLR